MGTPGPQLAGVGLLDLPAHDPEPQARQQGLGTRGEGGGTGRAGGLSGACTAPPVSILSPSPALTWTPGPHMGHNEGDFWVTVQAKAGGWAPCPRHGGLCPPLPPMPQEVRWLGVRPGVTAASHSFIHPELGDSLRANRGQRSAGGPTYSRVGGGAQGMTRWGLRRRCESRGPSQGPRRSPPQQDRGHEGSPIGSHAPLTKVHAPAHAETRCHSARLTCWGVHAHPPVPTQDTCGPHTYTPTATAASPAGEGAGAPAPGLALPPATPTAHSSGLPLPSSLAPDCPLRSPVTSELGCSQEPQVLGAEGPGHFLEAPCDTESVPMGTRASQARARPGPPRLPTGGIPHLWRNSHPLLGPHTPLRAPPPRQASHWDPPPP